MKLFREPPKFTASLSIQLKPELLKTINRRARKERRNRSRFVRRVLEDYCLGEDIKDERQNDGYVERT